MKGLTMKGIVVSGKMPAAPSIKSVPSAKDLHGMTPQGFKNTAKSSQSAGFSASRKCGSVKGQTGKSIA